MERWALFDGEGVRLVEWGQHDNVRPAANDGRRVEGLMGWLPWRRSSMRLGPLRFGNVVAQLI